MLEQARDVKRQVEAAPRAEDFAKEAGASVTYKPDGSWTATVRGADNIRRAVRMQDGARRIDVERGQKLDASRPKEVLVNEVGRLEPVAAHLAEQVAKKRGLRPKTFWGRPKERWVVRGGELVRVI